MCVFKRRLKGPVFPDPFHVVYKSEPPRWVQYSWFPSFHTTLKTKLPCLLELNVAGEKWEARLIFFSPCSWLGFSSWVPEHLFSLSLKFSNSARVGMFLRAVTLNPSCALSVSKYSWALEVGSSTSGSQSLSGWRLWAPSWPSSLSSQWFLHLSLCAVGLLFRYVCYAVTWFLRCAMVLLGSSRLQAPSACPDVVSWLSLLGALLISGSDSQELSSFLGRLVSWKLPLILGACSLSAFMPSCDFLPLPGS